MRVALYPRISSKKQELSGESIDSQINTLTKFCNEKGYEIVKTYIDSSKSASVKDDTIEIKIVESKLISSFNLNNRPAFKQMLEDAKKKEFEALIFFKWDRFSRNVIFSGLAKIYIERLGVELIPSNDDTDPLVIGIKSHINQDEVKKIGDRVKQDRLRKFDQGIFPSKIPFGYKAIYKNKKDRKGVLGTVLHPKESKIVREVFEMASEGINYREICNKFKLKPQSYYNILKNKVYIGMVEFDGKEKVGVHKIIIDKDIFEKVQNN